MKKLEEAIKHAEYIVYNRKDAISVCWSVKDCVQLAKWLRELQRARVLLKATHDLLEAADDSPYVEDVLAILVHYDDTDCDGSCLMEDIEYYFDEFGEEGRTDG